ncbi:MAG: carnitine dehydratase [Candidatus Rokuibacteriota bacterium]|nr:MAG: carnitine dehydratase [Candidatus Rokubacteria bacterium]
MTEAAVALEQLWSVAGGDPGALEQITLTGADPLLPTDFKIGTAASAVIGAGALAAAELWRHRTARGQSVSVDMRAAVAAFRSERYLRVDGQVPPDPRGEIFGFYRAGDGRWIQLHGAMPHHRDGITSLLGCESTRAAAAAAVEKSEAGQLEDALAAAGLPAGMVRSRAEWWEHAQGQALAALPLLEIVRIGDARPEPAGDGLRPLGGVRVLDLTRVIAGPVCGRTLASYGAEVLLVTAPHLPNMPRLVMDTGLGKLSASLDLRKADDAETLRQLIRGADVFCQSYRPGALARHGLSPEEVARLRPGIVYLAAFGALIALGRRAREGGSYLVRVSLAQTGRWVDALGRVEGRRTPDLTLLAVDDLLAETDTPFGRLRHVAPPARLSETPAFWSRPAVPPGTHAPAWAV